MPALYSTLAAFGLILVLSRLKVPLSAAILVGATTLGLMFRLVPVDLAWALLQGAIRPMTLMLVAITVMILTLSEAMRVGGQMDRIVTLARTLLRRPAIAMAALPALIGLLPMPGGAMFSAPMVAAAAGKTKVEPHRLSAINYWYRHLWEFWWPLYPGVIAAMILTDTDLLTFVPWQMPLSVFMGVSGLLIYRKAHPDLLALAHRPPAGTGRQLLRATASIWIILLVWLVGRLGLWVLPEGLLSADVMEYLSKRGTIGAGLLTSIVWTVRRHRLGAGAIRKLVVRWPLAKMEMLVISVMVFAFMIERVGATPLIRQELGQASIPPLLIVVALPFLAGMVTGLAIGFVGTSFPIVLLLALGMAQPATMPAYIALAYLSGHMGQMLSPLHLCYVLSNRHFGTSFGPVYKHILAPAAITLALGFAYFAAIVLLRG